MADAATPDPRVITKTLETARRWWLALRHCGHGGFVIRYGRQAWCLCGKRLV